MIRRPGWEADDIIATLARRGVEAGMEVVIVAGDKDLAQLVGDHVRMQDTMRDVTYDAELVRKKWGVPPALIPDLLALMGDDVDNIPGVPGIGQKGAAALLEKYGSLDGVLAHVGELKGKQKASLEENREAVKLYRELATVDANADIDVDARRAPPLAPRPGGARRALPRAGVLLAPERRRRRGQGRRRPRRRGGDPRHRGRREGRARRRSLPARPVALVPLFEPVDRIHHAHLVGLAVAAEGRPPFYLAFRGESGALGDAAVEILRDLFADESRPKLVHDVKELCVLCAAPRAHASAGTCSTP